MCAYLLIWNSFDELGTLLGIAPHKVCFYLQLLAFVVNLSIVLFHAHLHFLCIILGGFAGHGYSRQ